MNTDTRAVYEKYLPPVYGILLRVLDQPKAAGALEEIFTLSVPVQDNLSFWIQRTTRYLLAHGSPKQKILSIVIPPPK